MPEKIADKPVELRDKCYMKNGKLIKTEIFPGTNYVRVHVMGVVEMFVIEMEADGKIISVKYDTILAAEKVKQALNKAGI